MLERWTYHVIAVCAALCIALASGVSANRMAASVQDDAALAAYVIAGGDATALCVVDETAHEDHDCPFCRLLSDPADIVVTAAIWTLTPDQFALHYKVTARNDLRPSSHDLARAPPVRA